MGTQTYTSREARKSLGRGLTIASIVKCVPLQSSIGY